jgi:phage-related minor tail protein
MQALGVKFTDTGKKIGDSISSNTASTDANTRALNANTKAQGGKAPSDPVDELETDVTMAKGGILTGPTRALMGEAGPEAVLPLTRKNGKLGVAMFGNIAANGHGGGGYSIHIDARGAAPGVEKSIRSALRNSERRVLDSISRSASRSRRTT